MGKNTNLKIIKGAQMTFAELSERWQREVEVNIWNWM